LPNEELAEIDIKIGIAITIGIGIVTNNKHVKQSTTTDLVGGL